MTFSDLQVCVAILVEKKELTPPRTRPVSAPATTYSQNCRHTRLRLAKRRSRRRHDASQPGVV